MKYYMKSKLFKFKEDFWIKNENEEEVFFIDKKIFSLGLQFDIIKNNNILYQVKESLLTFMNNYKIYKSNDEIASVEQKLSFVRDKIKINSKYGVLYVEGDIFGINYRIIKDREIIAVASKELFAFTDNYEVDINFDDEAFILCLVVIIDDIIDKQRNNR